MAKKKLNGPVPSFDALMVPTIQALQKLGGSGSTSEIYEAVLELLSLPTEVVEVQHLATGTTETEYRLSWSRTYLKKYGLLSNSSRGVWALASPDIKPDQIDPAEIVKAVRDQRSDSQDASANLQQTDDRNKCSKST